MGNSTLHAIAIQELRQSNPAFHREYCQLVEGISQQIRELAKQHKENLDYSCFIETFDRSKKEPVLQIVIGAKKNDFQLLIRVNPDGYFVIQHGNRTKQANNSTEALKDIASQIVAGT